MKLITTTVCLFILFFAGPAFSKLNVVATLPWIGSIASEVGREKITVTTLVKPSLDPHQIEAKPSMILAARKADIIMYNGLDLEAGYLPLLVESSKNPRIQPGRPGNLDCSRFVSVIERQPGADRSMGDVHPLGNPHYHLSPRNMSSVADGIAGALSYVDPGHGAYYRSNAAAFKTRLEEKRKEWSRRAPRGKKFISYHKYFEYLADEFNFELVGYIEDKPGIPPSAGHVESLIDLARRAKIDGVLTTVYFSRKAPDFLSRKTGVRVIVVPNEVGVTSSVRNWFDLMDQVFIALAQGV
jgi:zinc/manganese transport system substrate-binding protein